MRLRGYPWLSMDLMARIGGRALRLARDPRGLPRAVARRVAPNSPRYGVDWVHLADGAITFREAEFVAASSPAMLLARHNYEVRRIHEELTNCSATRSLEIGCGYGRLSMAFAQHSVHHTAVDINVTALRAARLAYSSVGFSQAQASHLPFKDGAFGLITTWTVLQHVRPERIEQTCRELRRVLAPRGTILACEETRSPDNTGGHTWHRRVEDYRRLFDPLRLIRHGNIAEIDHIPGMHSPGEVMHFRQVQAC